MIFHHFSVIILYGILLFLFSIILSSFAKFVYLCFFYFRIISERLKQISLKLAEIQSGEAPEYLQPLAELEDNMRIRLEVAGVLRKFRLKNLDNQYEAEELTAKQNFEVFIAV